ncbi:hypothetical protein [Streptomyces sp. NPDC048202]
MSVLVGIGAGGLTIWSGRSLPEAVLCGGGCFVGAVAFFKSNIA